MLRDKNACIADAEGLGKKPIAQVIELFHVNLEASMMRFYKVKCDLTIE
jgi:hypothetical protein